MPRIKSLIIRAEFDVAKRSHNCQANPNHRVKMGQNRMKLRNRNGGVDNYCIKCSKKIVLRDLDKLGELLKEIENLNNSHD